MPKVSFSSAHLGMSIFYHSLYIRPFSSLLSKTIKIQVLGKSDTSETRPLATLTPGNLQLDLFHVC